jgi:hypothetical protein
MDNLLSSCVELKNKKSLSNLSRELVSDENNFTSNIQVQNCFDMLAKICSTPLAENPTAVPELIKFLERLQAYFDLENKYLSEYYAKCSENLIVQLGRSSSDLKHRHELQTLLLSALKENELEKALIISSIINGNTYIPMTNNLQQSSSVTNSSHSSSLPQQQPQPSGTNFSKFILDNFASRSLLNETKKSSFGSRHDGQDAIAGGNEREVQLESAHNRVNGSDTIDICSSSGNSNTQINEQNGGTSGGARTSNPIFSLNRIRPNPLSPIRHLICSPGLEETAHRYKIDVMFRGVCNQDCYQNKPWSDKLHLHYIVNTVNCNDHVSRLVKKVGCEFYNSFVLQTPERINQLIHLYKMQRMKPPKSD